MSLFNWRGKAKGIVEQPKIVLGATVELEDQLPKTVTPSVKGIRRSAQYSVRVQEGFKREILLLQAQLQEERQRNGGSARKVTEGELIELMLEIYKFARREGCITGHAVPIKDEVWDGLRQIAHHEGASPAEVFEQLVVEKFVALGLQAR